MLENETDDVVDELIRRRTKMDVPVEVEERLRRRLTEFRSKVEQRTPHRWSAFVNSLIYATPLRATAMTAVLLIAAAAGIVLMTRESRAGQVFAAAAAQLRSTPSLEYTIVLNAEPYVGVDFSYLAPGYRRINCSWGVEVRTDGTSGKQIVLMPGIRKYVIESGKRVESQADMEDFAEQIQALPSKADEVLGEKWTGAKKLTGYRLRDLPPNGSTPGLKMLDVWIDSATKEADHMDITVQEAGKPAHRMYIRNIRVGAGVDRSVFDLTPPSGYSAFAVPGGEARVSVSAAIVDVRVQIATGAPLTAIVMPMQGSYAQTQSAVEALDAYLKTIRVAPAGAPFGRYESEQRWEVGYPVPPGTVAASPFRLITIPATLTASAVVQGAWGQDSNSRWASFVKSVVEQGYVPAGPAMESWSGEEGRPESESTEMRMAVAKAK